MRDPDDRYFGHPLTTRQMVEDATVDQWRRLNDDDYRYEPWTAVLSDG